MNTHRADHGEEKTVREFRGQNQVLNEDELPPDGDSEYTACTSNLAFWMESKTITEGIGIITGKGGWRSNEFPSKKGGKKASRGKISGRKPLSTQNELKGNRCHHGNQKTQG